jgi:hypothetical protein
MQQPTGRRTRADTCVHLRAATTHTHTHTLTQQTRAPVDGAHGHLLRDAREERRDARLVGALAAGAQDRANHDVAKVARADAAALQHRAKHGGQQVDRVRVLEPAALGLQRRVGRCVCMCVCACVVAGPCTRGGVCARGCSGTHDPCALAAATAVPACGAPGRPLHAQAPATHCQRGTTGNAGGAAAAAARTQRTFVSGVRSAATITTSSRDAFLRV